MLLTLSVRFLLFLCDYCITALCPYIRLNGLFTYTLFNYARERNFSKLAISCLFLSVQSFTRYHLCGILFLVLIPALFATDYIKQHVVHTKLALILLTALSLYGLEQGIPALLFGTPFLLQGLISTLITNVSLLLLFFNLVPPTK